MSSEITGGCLCGAIRYRISQPVTELRACHCTHCQKASGTGGSINAIVPSNAVTITQGKPKRYEDTAASGNILNRYFCDKCGSPIYSQRQDRPDLMVVRAGSFDDSSKMKITAHIWADSARPWAAPPAGVETHPGNMPLK